MDTQEKIEAYCRDLARYLAPLDPVDAAEVIREIECHVLEVLEQQEQLGKPVGLEDILAGFGSPRELAARYVAHVLAGTPPPRGFRAIQRVKRGVTRSLYWSMAGFGYGLTLFCLSLVLAKLLMPASVGMWSAAGGNSVVIAFGSTLQPDAPELLGHMFAPIGLLLAVAFGLLTRRVLQVLARGLETEQ